MTQITVNLKALETMLFIWASVKDREKLADEFYITFARSPEMAGAYDEAFTQDSVRKVLSSISNREKLNVPTKAESRFWNYNMWMLEDPEMTARMLKPLKTLNLDALAAELSGLKANEVEVVFFPGQLELDKVVGNQLFVNFFLLKPDSDNPDQMTLDNKSILDYLKARLMTL